VLQTIASKPVRRSEIVLGKWLAFVLVALAYQAIVAGGVLLVARLIGHHVPPEIPLGYPLLMLEAVCLVTLSIAGGTRFTTVTNGVLAFGLYGLAFIGGWTEQVGAMTDNQAARNVGTVASLLMPTESLWQLAAWHMQPRILTQLHLTPFSPASVPSTAMIVWAAGWAIVVLALALRAFSRRPL
jgi:ABC-type transport system involved in multi-copper enzyme maturation permease subunit